MPTTIEKSFRRLHVTDDGKTIAAHERDNDVDEGVRVAIMTELGNSESFYSTPEDEPPSLQCVDGNSNGSYSQPLSSSSSDQRGPSWIPVHAPTCQHRWHTEHPHRPLHRFQHHNYPHTTAHDLPKPNPRDIVEDHRSSKDTLTADVEQTCLCAVMRWWPDPEKVADV